MKKYFLTMTVMALFAIGFASSDEDESTNSSSSTSETLTEQKKEDEAERKKKEREKKAAEENDRKAFVGDYVYSYDYTMTVRVYFKISLKSNGTFTHEPNNEFTQNMVNSEIVIDGKDYPSGGKWRVEETPAGKAVFLDFDGSWGEGSITPDKSVIHIDNMNGRKLTERLISN